MLTGPWRGYKRSTRWNISLKTLGYGEYVVSLPALVIKEAERL
jgi:hypothetical protein